MCHCVPHRSWLGSSPTIQDVNRSPRANRKNHTNFPVVHVNVSPVSYRRALTALNAPLRGIAVRKESELRDSMPVLSEANFGSSVLSPLTFKFPFGDHSRRVNGDAPVSPLTRRLQNSESSTFITSKPGPDVPIFIAGIARDGTPLLSTRYSSFSPRTRMSRANVLEELSEPWFRAVASCKFGKDATEGALRNAGESHGRGKWTEVGDVVERLHRNGRYTSVTTGNYALTDAALERLKVCCGLKCNAGV